MTIEIKTATLEPVRNTFAHIERRFGDKPATRYQEGTYDIQAVTNFHYKPMWQPEYELNDPRRTAIQMEDWYELRDPRQFYYGTYVQQRAKMQDVAENSYSFFEKRNLADLLSDDVKQKLIHFLVPLRHVEHTANLNNVYGTAYGYGTAVTQALLFDGMDRFGIAQYLSRIGLILDGNTGDKLAEAKTFWMEDEVWQGMRALCEETLVTKDWFELFIAQDLVIDTLTYDIFFNQFEQWLRDNGAQDVAMLMEFMQDWHKDASRWVDAVVKRTVSESDANKSTLEGWINQWRPKVEEALKPVAEALLGSEALPQAVAVLDKRLNKAGLFK